MYQETSRTQIKTKVKLFTCLHTGFDDQPLLCEWVLRSTKLRIGKPVVQTKTLEPAPSKTSDSKTR